MNRIVRENYPVSNLPADLREGLSSSETVTVTIELMAEDLVREPSFEDLMKLRGPSRLTSEQIQAQFDELREDRDL